MGKLDMPDDLKLSIAKLVYGGEGLAYADGNTVFVPYVLPGEEVRAATRKKQKKLLWAELLEVTSPAKERDRPTCPHFQKCGGCHYQHISASEQLRLKKEILRETLSRLGGISWTGEIVEHTAAPYGYRNRAQWAVRGGMPRALGYFLPESSEGRSEEHTSELQSPCNLVCRLLLEKKKKIKKKTASKLKSRDTT